MKNKIIEILKSAKANNWDDAAIATTIYNELINPQIIAKEHFRKQGVEALLELSKENNLEENEVHRAKTIANGRYVYGTLFSKVPQFRQNGKKELQYYISDYIGGSYLVDEKTIQLVKVQAILEVEN